MCFFSFLVSKGHKLIWLRMERETAISVLVIFSFTLACVQCERLNANEAETVIKEIVKAKW